MVLAFFSFAYSSTVIGNPINNLWVRMHENVYKSTVTVVECDNSMWSSEEAELWVESACEIHLEICDEEQSCWYEEISLQPEGAEALSVTKTGYTWQ